MIEKVRKIFDKGGTFGTLLTDLSKAWHTLCDTQRSCSKALCAELWYKSIQLGIWLSDRKESKSQNQLQFQLISGYIPMYPAKINFRTTIIHSIALSLIFICWGNWYYELRKNCKQQEKYFSNGFQIIF